MIFRDSQGNKLNGLLQEVSKSVCIIVHGFRDTKEGNTPSRMRLALNEQGVSTFRFDVFAHGESDGKFEDLTLTKAVDGLLAAIDMMKEMGFTQIGLLGTSFGGMICLLGASKSQDISYLVLKSPVVDYVAIESGRRDVAKWKKDGIIEIVTRSGKSYRMGYEFFEDAGKHVAYYFADKVSMPVLIVQGDVDTIVPVEQTKKLAPILRDCKLEILEGCDHWFNGHYFDQFEDLAVSFVLKHKKA